MSFALCSMHILFDSNKFHKFWMSCACRSPLSKDSRNHRKSTFCADRPGTSTYMGPILSLEQCDMFIRFQNKVNISYPVSGPERHKVQLKSPHISAKIVKWGNYPFQRQCGVFMCNVGEMKDRGAPEVGRPAQEDSIRGNYPTYRPPGVIRSRPRKVGGQVAAGPGRPAPQVGH